MKATKAKRERDGWRVEKNTNRFFSISDGDAGYACVRYDGGPVFVYSQGADLTPARAAQFAAKVAAIAAKAAKEAKDGR